MASVSIVTPSYNQSDFIGDTLDSVRNQSYEDVNHIVVDGGSDDGTVEMLRSYDDLDWTSESDDGQADAINKGFRRADGDIVGWINSDDVYVFRDTIDNVVEVFDATSADIVFGHGIRIGPDNEFFRAHYIPPFDYSKLEKKCYILQPAVFFRDYVVEEHKLDEGFEYSFDYEFWLRLGKNYEWQRADVIVAGDRNHPERKIISDNDRSIAESLRLKREREIEWRIWDNKLYEVWLRSLRLRGLPLLFEIHDTPRDRFAFEIDRPPVRNSLKTQLYGKRIDLL